VEGDAADREAAVVGDRRLRVITPPVSAAIAVIGLNVEPVG